MPTIKTTRAAMRDFLTDYRQGHLDRRSFLALATSLGVSRAAATALAGVPAAAARAQDPGVTTRPLRIQMEVRPLSDPRLYSWSEMANATRGMLEYLVTSHRDGTFTGALLEGWEANADASEYVLRLRPGITWSNGDAFVADDVVANLHGWADTGVAGNSMASRVAALINPSTGRARDGAITDLDRHTVRVRLERPDVTFIPGISDYPAAVQHRDHIGSNPLDHGIGTGAFRITEYDVGVRAVLDRRLDVEHWRHPTLDRVEFIDLGPDPGVWLAAAAAGEIDMLTRAEPDFMEPFSQIGWQRHGVDTATTVVVRPNQRAMVGGVQPYADRRVRRALALAVDNAVCLELGIAGRGQIAQNHHVAPIQPDYAPLPPIPTDPAAARALMAEAGMMEFEHDIVSVDDTWRRNTADAVAAQLMDAGFRARRTIVPRRDFATQWRDYPFSATNWNHRALGIEVLSLAYRSDASWNETGFSNPEFDALLDRGSAIVSDEERREIMARLERMMQDEGVTIQPFWQSLYRFARVELRGAQMHPRFEIDPHELGWS